jgi:hypothetical protein
MLIACFNNKGNNSKSNKANTYVLKRDKRTQQKTITYTHEITIAPRLEARANVLSVSTLSSINTRSRIKSCPRFNRFYYTFSFRTHKNT